MARRQLNHIVIVGAGAAGLMAARELGRAAKRVTILEARERCGGRIQPLPAAQFGYKADGGAEFIHGEAPITRGLLRQAGLSSLPVHGARWNVENGTFSRDERPDPHMDTLHEVLAKLTSDMSVAAFLRQYFAGPEFTPLRHTIVRMVEGYDAADPERASVLALRDEWMNSGRSMQARIVGGYRGLIDFLATECRKQGADIHFNSPVNAIEASDGGALVRCADGSRHAGDAAILTVPLPLVQEIVLPPPMREKVAAAADIGFGNVIKILLSFKTRWWTAGKGKDLSELLFLLSDEAVPVWWTQHPAERPVLTGWLAGPRTTGMAERSENELVELGLASLAAIFGLSVQQLKQDMIAARAINWANDPFARGAYSYAMLKTRSAQSELASWDGGAVLLSGEALYRGPDMGTVEAALASGLETARTILAAGA
jgi:monoamine oxidase